MYFGEGMKLVNQVNYDIGSRKKERERLFETNGRELLKEVIRSSKDGLKCNPVRSFSAEKVLEATNHFDSHYVLASDVSCYWYKGCLDSRPLLISKYLYFDQHFRDIVVSLQMSNHGNVLKLLGCCLEFSEPVLVYESAENGALIDFVGSDNCDGSLLSWKMKLRIAKDVANAIIYLHTAFPRPIVHRNITPTSIFLDKNYAPKLGGFALSVSQVKVAVMGTVGYADPYYYCVTGFVSEKSDVYSFGAVLLVLLTGKKAFDLYRHEDHICRYVAYLLENRQYDDIVDSRLFEDEGRDRVEEHRLQISACLELAMSCVSVKLENRPLMIDVAKKLLEIARPTV